MTKYKAYARASQHMVGLTKGLSKEDSLLVLEIMQRLLIETMERTSKRLA